MLNPRTLGFPDEDSVTSPQTKRPFFAAKKKAPAPQPSQEPGVSHPADPHLRAALSATDHKKKQHFAFKAIAAIRKAAMSAPTTPPTV